MFKYLIGMDREYLFRICGKMESSRRLCSSFWSILCHIRADYLAAEKDKMDAAGVALVLIGPGSVDQARKFYEQTKFKGGRSENNTSIHGRLWTGLGAFFRKGHQDTRWLVGQFPQMLL